MRISLADREAERMSVLWDHGPSTVSEVQAHLADELAYTTVLTMLRKLEAKQYIGHKEEGRAHRCHALIEREAVLGRQVLVSEQTGPALFGTWRPQIVRTQI